MTSPETGVGDAVRDDEVGLGKGLCKEAERGGIESGEAGGPIGAVERGKVLLSAETSTGDSTMVGDTICSSGVGSGRRAATVGSFAPVNVTSASSSSPSPSALW